MSDVELLQRRFERERKARKEAERLLENKSRQLYDAIKTLQDAKVLLEREVEERRQGESVLQDNEQRLRASQQRLNAIMNSVIDGVITTDAKGIVQSFNRSAERIFGYSMTEVLGKSVVLLLPEAQRREAADPLGEVMGIGRPDALGVTRELTAGRKDGGSFPLEIAVSELDLEGETLYVAVSRDISHRKAREQERLALERELSQAQKMESLGTLSGGIAHELNTPIQYVGDNVRFLLDGFKDLCKVLESHQPILAAAKSQPALEEICKAAEEAAEDADLDYLIEEIPQSIGQTLEGVGRVSQIVQAIKEFSHPDGGEMSLVDLNHAIKTTATVASNQWKYVAELAFELDETLPQVPCLAGELNQVILNLIVNAADAIEDKGAEDKGTITVSTARRGELAEVRVVDTGTGIPEEIRKKIFDPFFTTKEPGRGSGQGLSICHTIIHKKHGGRLEIETKPGEGTTFIILLPLAAEAAKQEVA